MLYLQFARVQCRQWRMRSTSQHWKPRPSKVSSGSSVSVRGSGLGIHLLTQQCRIVMIGCWYTGIEVVSFCRADCYVERRVVVLDRRRCFSGC